MNKYGKVGGSRKISMNKYGTVLESLNKKNYGKGLIRLEMRKWTTNRIEEILVSNSSLVSGLSEASGVRVSWVEVSQKVRKINKNLENSAY